MAGAVTALGCVAVMTACSGGSEGGQGGASMQASCDTVTPLFKAPLLPDTAVSVGTSEAEVLDSLQPADAKLAADVSAWRTAAHKLRDGARSADAIRADSAAAQAVVADCRDAVEAGKVKPAPVTAISTSAPAVDARSAHYAARVRKLYFPAGQFANSSDAQVADLGEAVCRLFDSGLSYDAVARGLTSRMAVSPATARAYLRITVNDLCPEKKPS